MAERPLYTLYKNLKAQNYDVPDDYNKFESALTRDGKGGADNRHAIYENLKAQNFDVPSTYERFYSALFEPRSKTSSRAKGGSVPMSAADRARFSAGAAAISASAQQTMNNAGRYNRLKQRKQKQQKDFGRVNLGTHQTPYGGDANNVVKDDFAYNPETGKTGAYVTSDNENVYSLPEAEQMQAILDKQNDAYQVAVDTGEIPSAFDVRDKNGNYDLQENIGKNGTYLTEEGAQKQFDKKLADAYARKKEIEALIAEDNRQHGNPLLSYGASIGASNGRTAEQSDYRNKLATSLSLVTEQIGALEAVKQYPTSSWGEDALKALDNTAFTAKTWDFGLTDFATMGQMERIKTKMDNNIPLSGSDKMLLMSKLGADAAAALEDEKMGNVYRWTKIAGQSLPFMADFFLTGGYGGITKGISRGALKIAAKRGMGKVSAAVLKNTGIVIGDIIGSYAMAGTEQALKTGADIMQRHLGNLYQDEKGDYKFGTFDENGNLLHEGGESIGTALYKGMTSAMVENYTEKLFGHNYGIKKGAVNFMEKHGMNASAEFFKNIGKSGWYTNSKKWMEKFGINGFAEEVMEEEIGIPLHALLDGEGKVSDLLDAKQQLDIIGGMAISVGSMYAMGAGSRPVKGIYNRAQYYRFRNKVNVADSDAQNLMGDNWADIKDKIDNATNEQMGGVLADILRQRDTMTKEQINAAVNYGVNLMKMRGYNIAKTAEMNAKEITNEPTTPEEQHQADIDNAYSEGHDADDADKHDIQIQQEDQMKTLAAALGISEQQLSAMSDEELESLTGQDDKLDQAIYDYQLSSARYQGVVDDAQDKVDLAAHQAEQRVDMYTDQSRGSVRNATIKASGGLEDYGVYIISGNIATHDDGSIDVSNSDGMILYYDPTTNSVEHADALMFAELGEELPADDVKAQAVADAKENAIKEVAGIIDGTVEVGSQFNVTDTDGTEHTYEVLADYGDGTAAISIDGNVVENPYSLADLQQMKDLEDQKRLEAAKAEREQMEKERAAQQNQETEETQPSFDFNQILNDNGNVVLVDVLDKDGNTKYPDSRLFLIRDAGAKAKVVELKSDGTLVPHAVNKEDVATISSMSLDEYKQAMPESSMIEDNSGEESDEDSQLANLGLPKGSEIWMSGDGFGRPKENTLSKVVGIDEQGSIVLEDKDGKKWSASFDYINNHRELPPLDENTNIVNEENNQSESNAEENTPAPEQTPAMTLEDETIVPMLEDGNPDFSKLTAAQTAELYDTQFGEDADSIVSGYVSDAKKALDKASNMTVKGKTFVEQKAAKDAKEKAIADAQAAYDSAIAIRDAYNERQLAKVEDTAEGRKELIEKARRKFARLKSVVKDDAEAVSQLYRDTIGSLLHRLYDSTGIDVTDTTPLTAEEYVASNLGAHSLNYEGTETSKGVKQETGLSREDFAKTQLLAADGKGTTIDALVHSLWENRPSNLESLDTQDIRNALIGVLNSGFKASEARNFVENIRIAQAENILEEQKRAQENAAYAEQHKAESEAELKAKSDEKAELKAKSEAKLDNESSNESNDLDNDLDNEKTNDKINDNINTLTPEQQKAKEDGEKLGFPAFDKEGEPINEYVVELAEWAKEQGLEIDPTSKLNSYADLFLMCKDGFGVSTLVPDEGENINQVVYFPDNVQDFDQLWKLQEEFNAGRDLKHSSNIDSEITEGATFYDADTAREFKEFVDKKVEEQNKVFGEQRPEEDLPFSAKENGKQQTTAERAADVEKNKVDDMKVVDNIVGEKTRKAFERLAKMMGANIQWQYSDKLGNGWIQETTDADGNVHRTIFITLDSSIKEGAQFIFGHEMTHQIKKLNPAAYNELTQLVLDTYCSDAFDKAVDKTMQRYSDAGFSGRARDYYAEEVVADSVGEMIRDLNLAHTLAMKMSHPLLSAIHEILQKIKLAFFGTEYNDVTKNIIRSIEQAYVKTANGQVTNSETGEDVSFSLRQKPEPKKKGVGYKVFVLKDGKLYPPMVANPDGAATPVGVWLDADAAPIAGESKTGRPQVKQGGKGTQGGSGKLAYRPGWHLGVVPYAIQFNRKDAEGNKTLFPKNFVFAEVEYAADVDYQEEARQEGINPSGKYQHSLAGLKHLPTDGYYMYRTNPNPETDPWVITGAMKVNRILTRAEQAELVKNAGREPQQIQEGDIVTDDVVNSINQEIADAPKFSLKVYHGSGADFTEFDFDHMGEGAGSQAFGWGGYVTSSEEIGKSYVELTRKKPTYVYNGKEMSEDDLRSVLLDKVGRDNANILDDFLYNLEKYGVSEAKSILRKGDYAYFKDLLKGTYGSVRSAYQNKVNAAELLLAPRNIRVKKYKGNLYEVDIPEDNGSNYLDWDAPITDELIDKVAKALPSLRSYDISDLKKDRAFDNFYKTISMRSVKDDASFNDDKAASKLLSSLGYTGIKYKAGRNFGGAEEGDTNYVIFKPEYMRITEHTKFSLKTKPVRFEAGKKLSDEEKKEVLSTLKDAYKVNGVPYHIEETAGGKEKRVYEPTADSYVVSDITNRPLRYYITLPDGRVAHPTEVYPNISDNEVKSSATKQGLLDDEADQIISAAIGNMKDIADNAKAIEVLTELQNLPHETHDVGYGLNNAQSYKYKTGIFTSDAAQAIDYVVRRMRRKEDVPTEIPAALKKAVADSYGMVDNLIGGMSTTKFSLKKVNDDFNQRLEELVKNPNQKDKILRLGRSSSFLKVGGITDAEIELDFDKFIRKSGDKYKKNHPFVASDLINLPMALAEPIAVFNSTTANDHVVLTELQKDGKNFIVAVRAVEQHRKGGVVLEVNKITSLYPKEERGIVYWINNGRISNVDKEKALHFIEALQPHAGTTITDEELKSAANIINSFETTKGNGEKVDVEEPKTFEEFLNHPSLKFSIKNEEQRKAAEDAYEYASKLRPNKYAQYALVDMSNPSNSPQYYEKRVLADRWRRFYNKAVHNELDDVYKDAWGNYKLIDLDRPFADQVNEVKGDVPNEFNAPNVVANKNAGNESGAEYHEYKQDEPSSITYKDRYKAFKQREANREKTAGLRKERKEVEDSYNSKSEQRVAYNKQLMKEYMDKHSLSSENDIPDDVWEDLRSKSFEKYQDELDSLFNRYKDLDKQIKAVAEPRFSLKEEKTLAGVHNITEEKLRKALKLGGFANPSLAVIDTNKSGHNNFGEISFIAPSALLDKRTGKTGGTWITDAYTQRYPSVERQMSEKGSQKFEDWVDSLEYPSAAKAEIKRQTKDVLEDNGVPAWELMYLKEKGIDIKAYDSNVDYRWKEIINDHPTAEDILNSMKTDPELNEKVTSLAKHAIIHPTWEKVSLEVRRKMYEETGVKASPINPQVRKQTKEIFERDYAPSLLNKNGTPKKSDVKKVVEDIVKEHNDTKKYDFYLSKVKASNYVNKNGLYDDYIRWQENKLDEFGTKNRIFRGYTRDGSRKYVPETLENVSKAMREEADGQTNGSEYTSFGSFIAKLASRVDSTDEMRANKDKLSSNKDKEEFYEKWSEVYYDLAKFLYNDVFYGEQRLHDIVLQSDPKKYAKKEYGITLTPTFMKKLDALKNAVQTELKSAYFETKYNRPLRLNEFAAAVVPDNLGEDVRKGIENAGLPMYDYDPNKEGDRSRAFNEAINSSDNIRFSLKSMMEKPEGWKQANKKAIHIAEAIERDPKFSLKNLDGTLIKAGTYFSGGGLVEEGLKGIIDPVVAVEYDEKISGVYRNNFGQHIVTADVRDVDPKELVKQIDGEVEYFHASPVCKNYSQAKSNHVEVELDKETAASTAEFINAVKPKVVTIENVKGYKDSEAMKIITDALDANGYTWDADVYNAADYGGYTNRERLIVRAVRDGKLPEKPKKMARKSGWYEAVADIIPTLTEKKNGVAPWMDIRLKADGIDWRHIDKPLYVMGSAYADGKVPHAFADELLPTLRTKSGDVIVMPDGKVYRAMGRVLARVSGVSDDYKMPFSENLSHTIIGNGIPTQLTEHVIAPLLQNTLRPTTPEDGNTRFSLRYDQFEHDLNQWKKDNNLPKDAQRPTIPQRNAGESAVDFLKRVDEYRKQMALWKTAPTYEQHLLSDDTALGEFNRELQKGSVLKRIAFQDSMLAIRKAQKAIMKEVGVDRLNMAEDAYTAENRSHGKGKNEFEEYNNEFLQPLRKAYHQMKKVLGDSYDNVRIYMMAKHGLERDAQIAFKKSLEADYEDVAQRSAAYKAYKGDMNRIINDSDLEFGRVDFTTWRQRDNALRAKYSPSYMDYRYDKNGIAYDYSGLSALFDGSDFEEAAYKLVKDIEDKYVTETHNLWDATNAATKKILRDSYKAGMMSKDSYQYVRDMYSHYIPLRGWDGTTADQVWDYIGGGKGAFNQTLKTAHGRTSIADDPIAYIENMAESGILLNNKNWVKQHLMLLAQNHPTSLLTLSKAWYVKSVDDNGNEEWIPATPQITSQMNSNQVKAAIDAFEKKMEQMAQTGDATQKRDGLNIAYPQTHSEEREHEVRVMKDGEEYVIYVNGDPQLAQAMNNTRAHRVREIQSGKLDRAAAWLGRKMAAAYTSLSPLFIPSNYFRDLTMTLASTAIREDAKYNYLLRKNLATSWNLGFMLRNYQNGKLREKVNNGNATPKEQMFYDFMMNGGETGFVSSLDVEDLKKKFKNDLKDLDRWKANPVKVGHTIMDGIEFLNRAIEDSNRFAVYMTSIQYGRSIDEAVNDAKDVTLNFNRKGTGEYGWQMIRNLYLFINPAVQSLQTLGALVKHHPFKFTAVTASWLASGVLVPIVNAALMSLLGGDDDKDKYWQFTKWDRRNNLIMWVPFTHEYIKIPLAQEFRAFYGVGDMIASKMMGGELAEESWSQYAEDLLGQVVDMLPLDPTGYDGNIAVSLMPNAIRPVFELAFNVDFTGKPLFKETEYNKYDPNFTKAYVGTPDWLVRASKMVNSIGNDYPDVQQNSIDAFGDPRYNLNNPAVVDHVLSSYLGGAYTMGSQVLGVLTKSLNDPKEIKVADIPLFSKFVSNPDDRPVTKKQGDEFWNMKENHDRAANTLSKLKKQAKVDGDYSMLERFYGSEEYKQYKQDDVKVKKYEEDKKKERAEESGEEYRSHKLNAEDIYKAHATPKDDFEDLKLKQLYTKLNGFKTSYDLLVDTAPSQSDGYYNTNKAAIDAIDEISLDKQEISELKKGFLDDGKDAYNAEDMKQIRDLRKKILAVLEKANKVVVANQKAKAEK